MRVIIDTRPLLERHRSGVGTYAAEMTKALVRRAANDYALFANGASAVFPDDLPAESGGVRRVLTRYPNRLLNASFFFLQRPHIESLAGDADAVYLPNLNFVATKKPLVVTVHDLSFVRYSRFFSPKQRLWHAAVNPAMLLKKACAVIAVSEHTKNDIVETFGVDPAKIAVANPGVDASFIPQNEAAVAEVRERFDLRKPFFLSLGTLEPRKNVTGIIDAFEKIDADADLVVAGGKGWMYEDIFTRAARSPKRDRIRFLGYVDAADKPALYAAATALVYPAFYEGFGMPPLEAMAVGTPVIASHVSSLGEVVGDAGILVEPSSSDGIAQAMRTVLEDAALVTMLRQRGLQRAKQFTWTRSAEILENVFKKIAK
jgi:glycosyltransferase involved in cell wall biosynthesis